MGRLDRGVAWLCRAASFLVLPLSALLFLQWPLRDIVRAGSREANDLAQILFALYVSVAIAAATRERTHLAADTFAHRYRPATRESLWRAACAAILVPASAFILWSGGHAAWSSLLQLERFPESFNPGYFLIRIAALLLAACILAQALLDLFARPGARGG